MSSTAANVNGALQNLNYNPLFRSGYQDNGYTMGLALDKNKNTIYTTNDMSSYVNVTCAGNGKAPAPTCPTGFTWVIQAAANNVVLPAGTTVPTCAGSWIAGCTTAVASTYPEISNYPDYMSLLSVGGNLYTINQFEDTPAMMYMSACSAYFLLLPVCADECSTRFAACSSSRAGRQRRADGQAGHAAAGGLFGVRRHHSPVCWQHHPVAVAPGQRGEHHGERA